ncbi:MAG TPA: M15 family metallopeptidase, partial [Nannocystaceae bacterium]|nr:M15 family metallopeptidase [Nannocystaceae bacterium]
MTRGLALVLAIAIGCEPAPSPEPAPPAIAPPPVVASSPAVDPVVAPPPAAARRSSPPPPGLVDVVAFVPHVRLAIGYATADNFTGAPLPGYDVPGAWLHPAATDALAAAARELADDGLAIVVFDAYRPRRASVAMVEWARASGRMDLLRDGFVA